MLLRFVLATLVFLVSRNTLAAIRTVALSGQRTPTEGSTVYFGSLHEPLNPVINDAGTVAFASGLSQDGEWKHSIWIEERGVLREIARTGDPAPGTSPEVTFAYFDTPNVNELGSVFFGASLNDQNGELNFQDQGIWIDDGHSLRKIVRPGDQVPGRHPGVVFESPIHSRTLNNRNQTAFWNSGTFVGDADSLQNIAGGGSAPGLNADIRLGGIGIPSYPLAMLNDSGQFAFRSLLSGPSINADNDGSLWLWNGSEVELIARDGDVLPGLSDGEYVRHYEWPASYSMMAINNAGHLAFHAVFGASEDQLATGIWLKDSTQITPVAQSFDNAPGIDGGVTFAHVGLNVMLNAADELVFSGSLLGPSVTKDNLSGLWAGKPGDLRLVARAGDPAPGAGDGYTFDDLIFTMPSINSRGQVAFAANLIDSDSTDSNIYGVDAGIWAETASGELMLIVRDGDQIEVAPGDIRTVLHVNENFNNGSGNQDGLRSFFNNRGELVFAVTFTDGSSGIFVSDAVAIPEPGSYCLILGLPVISVLRRELRWT